MRKKRVLLIGMIIVLSTLFLNVIFSDRSAETNLTIANIEAMAEEESPGNVRRDLCVESGYICVGTNKDKITGVHHGLMRAN